MDIIKDIMFQNGIFTLITDIFPGLKCGIIFSKIFTISDEELKKMSMLELHLTLLLEIYFMSILIYWYIPIFNYFGRSFQDTYDYKNKEYPKIHSNVLFAISFLVGNKSISKKINAIIHKYDSKK